MREFSSKQTERMRSNYDASIKQQSFESKSKSKVDNLYSGSKRPDQVRSIRCRTASTILPLALAHWTSCHGCHKRRVDMKALARYQLILLGKQRHIGVNNLPKVVARQCRSRESKPQSADCESETLPLHHRATTRRLCSVPKVPKGTLFEMGYLLSGAIQSHRKA